jgi:hypothetical protein
MRTDRAGSASGESGDTVVGEEVEGRSEQNGAQGEGGSEEGQGNGGVGEEGESEEEKNKIIVDWYEEDDPDNPQNWYVPLYIILLTSSDPRLQVSSQEMLANIHHHVDDHLCLHGLLNLVTRSNARSHLLLSRASHSNPGDIPLRPGLWNRSTVPSAYHRNSGHREDVTLCNHPGDFHDIAGPYGARGQLCGVRYLEVLGGIRRESTFGYRR